MKDKKGHHHDDSALQDRLFFSPLYDLGPGKQFVLSVSADGMKLITAHQVINVLTGTIENAACLGCAHNTVLQVMMQRLYGQWNGCTVAVQDAVRKHCLIVPVYAKAIRLYFNRVETFLAGKVRGNGRGRQLLDIHYLCCSVLEEDQKLWTFKRDNFFHFGLPAEGEQFGERIGRDLFQVAVVLLTAPHGKHQEGEFIIFLQPVVPEDLADVLPVLRDNALLHKTAAPGTVYAVFAAVRKRRKKDGQIPAVGPIRKLDKEGPGSLMVNQVTEDHILRHGIIFDYEKLHKPATSSRSFPRCGLTTGDLKLRPVRQKGRRDGIP